MNAKHQTQPWIRDPSQDRQPEIHSSVKREDSQRIMGKTNNDCRFWIFISTKFPAPATFACWKIRFKTEVCTCSQFPTEAILWIKEVEKVDSVGGLRVLLEEFEHQIFEVLDAKIAFESFHVYLFFLTLFLGCSCWSGGWPFFLVVDQLALPRQAGRWRFLLVVEVTPSFLLVVGLELPPLDEG